MENLTFIFIILFVHVAGFLLLVINYVYLICRGEKLRKVICGQHERDLDSSDEELYFKIQNSTACSILMFYHLILIAIEVVLAIVCTTDEIWKHEFNYDEDVINRNIDIIFVLWVTAVINYVLVMLYLIPFVLVPLAYERQKFTNWAGGLVTYNFFSFYNCVIFWGSLFLLLHCVRTDCTDTLSRVFQFLGDRYAVISLAVSYVLMQAEASVLKRYIVVSIHGNRNPSIMEFSQDEAVDKITEKL